MGFKIKNLIEDVERSISPKKISNKQIAVDAFNFVYQFTMIKYRREMAGDAEELDAAIADAMLGFTSRTIKMIKYNIRPIYAFEGNLNMKKWMTEDEYIMYAGVMEKAKTITEYIGIPIIESITEGEAQATRIVMDGNAYAVASQDFDSLLYGAKRILRNIASWDEENKHLTIILLDDVLTLLNISHDQLIDMSILMGTDFHEGIKGIGPKKSLKLVQQYGNLENIVRNESDIHMDRKTIDTIRSIFKNPKVKTDYGNLKMNNPNYTELEKFMLDIGCKGSAVNAMISELKRIDIRGHKDISSFF